MAQKYKDKLMSQTSYKPMNESLVKHSEIFNNMFTNYLRVSGEVEQAKKIIN